MQDGSRSRDELLAEVERLRSRLRELETLLDSTPDMIFMKDRALRTTMCNRSFARALGKDPSELIGRTDVENGWDPELVRGNPEKGIRGFEQDDRDALSGRTVRNPHDPANFEGEVRVFDTHKLPVRDARGAVVGVLGIARDITDRVRAEAALRRSESQFRRIIDVSPVPYALNDEKQNVTYLNPAFVRTFGYELTDIPTLDAWWPKAYPDPPYREWVATSWNARIERARRDGTAPGPLELTIRCKDGSQRTALVSAVSLGDAFAGIHLVILYDITELRRAEDGRRVLEERSRDVQRLESLGLLAGGVAHDFNNMLLAILGNADLALLDLPEDSRARRAVDEIVRVTRSCAGLANQMLAYSGKGHFVVEELDLLTLLGDVKGLLQASLPKKVTLAFELPGSVPAISADASQMKQVLLNLAMNAGEAIGENAGRVTISIGEGRCVAGCPCREFFPMANEWPERDCVVLSVSDTGHGMDEATRARIFEPFFTTKFTGRGLGLAAVHGILRGHRAGVHVTSDPGRGTTFAAHLPALDRRFRSMTSEPSTERRWRGRGIVLLVDDEEPLRRVGRLLLGELGFTVVTAADGTEAIDVFRKHGGEVVCAIVDLSMPRSDGSEAFAGLRRLRPDLPVLLTSGYGEQTITERIGPQERCAFLPKPYQINDLEAKLRALLEG